MTLTSRSGVASSRRAQNAVPVTLTYIACRFAFRATPISHAETKQMPVALCSRGQRYGLYEPRMSGTRDPVLKPFCLLKLGLGRG